MLSFSNCSPIDYTRGPSFFSSQMENKEGDFSPNNDSFEKINETINEEDSLEESLSNFHMNLIDTMNNLNKISENLHKEIQRTSISNNSLENFTEMKAFKQKNSLKIQKFKSPISNENSSKKLISSIRRTTVRNMPGALKKSIKFEEKNLGIYFGHENWNLVLNMIIGIRTSIKSLYSVCEDVPVESYEFSMKGHFELIQKGVAGFDMRKASKFYDYAPSIFERIRKKFGISNEGYLRSIGPENLLGSIVMGNLASLTELMSSGKSGSFFYFTGDCMVFSLFSF